MKIQSNTLGKLQKIRNGNVFESPLIFIRELLQNSQRSKANNVDMLVDGNSFICVDDGCGCTNPENVFTLDLSSWESTNEGYGIGFWSILSIPNIKKLTVLSDKWECTVDVEKLFREGDLTVERKAIQKMKGFKVILESDYFESNCAEIEQYVFEVAKLLPFRTTINELVVYKRDVFDLYQNQTFCKIYDNRFFRAKLAISTNSYDNDISLYYDKRLVNKVSITAYVEGIMEVKKDKITLREPDRTYYRRDEKYYALAEKLEECCRDLYLSYIKQYGLDDEGYNPAISYWLQVKDYEKYLVFDDNMLQDSLRVVSKDSKTLKIQDVIEENIEDVEKETESVEIDKDMFVHDNSAVVQNFSVSAAKKSTMKPQPAQVAMPALTSTGSSSELLFKDKIKKLKKVVWCTRQEYSVFADEVQKAKYKGFKVIIAKNILYETALRKYGIINIVDLHDAFSETYIKKDICLKTEKEEAFMALLEPIRKLFGLEQNTFLIANLAIESNFVVDDKVIAKDIVSNKKNNIQIYGVCDGTHVYLDRTAIALNKFNIKKGQIGKSELKALMYSVNTIAHELAHLLYHTTDNTPEHYNKEIAIQQAIIQLYV